MVYRPLATAIVGERPVHVASGVASRRALARVGKVAATTGDTIHLATPRPRPDVIAHELTHVAHPSPVARFFDDDDRGPEERRAEQVAAIMRRSPILPRAAADIVRRSTSTSHTSSPATISAASLAAQITGHHATSGHGDTIQRAIGGHRTRGATAPATTIPIPQTGNVATDGSTNQPPAPSQAAANATAPAVPDLTTQFDRILELLEDRVLRELERRGGRFRGGF